MRRYRFVWILSFILLWCLVTACGRQETGKEQSVPLAGTESAPVPLPVPGSPREDAISWQASYSRLENPYTAALAEDAIYGCYTEDGRELLDSINREDFAVDGTFRLPEGFLLSGLAADREGHVYLLGKQEEKVGLWRVDAKDGLQDYMEMELEDTDRAEELTLRGVCTDGKGYLYVWCRMLIPTTDENGEAWCYVDRVYVRDEQLKTVYYEEIMDGRGTQVLLFGVGEDGAPRFTVKDREGVYLQEMNVEQRERGEAVRLENFTDTLPEHMTSTTNGFLYCQDNELYEFDCGKQERSKILNLSTYGIFAADILFLAKRGETIEIIDNHGDAGYSELISFTLGAAEKETVTLGVVMTVQDLEQAVAEFNRYSGEYRVEIVDYFSQAESYEDASDRLSLDIVTGKAPDIIALSGIDYSMFCEKGVLADLYEFMWEDEDISRDMLVQSVAKAYESHGKLYSIAPAFQLHSMWGYDDVTGGQSGVTFEELFRILEERGKDINAITGFSADEPVLTGLCSASMDEFVDWENGTCDFEGEYFKNLLSFCREYTGNYNGRTHSERIMRRETVFSVGIISSVADYQIQKALYGNEVSFIGYPVPKGSGTSVTFRASAVAINAANEDPAGAWAFVKFYLLRGYDGQGFPVVKEQFDQVLTAAMREHYTVSMGRAEKQTNGYYNDGNLAIYIYEASREEVDAVASLVESAENRYEQHPEIQNIINEEAEMFFHGQADLDRTAEKIQSRVSLLLQELQ